MTAMRFQTKFLLSLTLVFLLVSVPFGQSAVSVQVGDTVELNYKIVAKNYNGSSGISTGKLKHVVTAVVEQDGNTTYSAEHTKTHPDGDKTNTVNITITNSTPTKFKQSDLNDMSNDAKINVSRWLFGLCYTMLEVGLGFILNGEHELKFTFNYTESDTVRDVYIDATWGEDGRLQYFKLEGNIGEDSSVMYEFGGESAFNIPGFPVAPFLGVSALAILMVMRKSKKVE
jgi:hypothetical protein